MATPPAADIRAVFLTTIADLTGGGTRGNLQTVTVLRKVSERLNVPYPGHQMEEAILTQWQELFRTGLLAWGSNLSNPDPPFFHLTESGRRALANANRDPSNPAGYLKHLESRASIGPVAKSYLVEGLDCYVAGLFKASAVMVGAAAESILLELRDLGIAKLGELNRTPSRDLQDWKIRAITRGLGTLFDSGIDGKTHQSLRNRYDMYWDAFTGQIRTTRNDAGHPISVEPITAETVHASLLIFPELASLASALWKWIADDMQ